MCIKSLSIEPGFLPDDFLTLNSEQINSHKQLQKKTMDFGVTCHKALTLSEPQSPHP